MRRSWLFALWAGGGNVGPFLCLARALTDGGDRVVALAPAALGARLADAGAEPVVARGSPLPDADDVLRAVRAWSPDALVVDYMLTGAACAAERSGLPWVALVHTLYRALLADGAPHPIGMAGPVPMLNRTRAALGLAPVERHGDLLDAADLVLVPAPRELDAPGAVPANVAYAGSLVEGPGPDRAWTPPPGDGPLVVVSTGTAGDAATDSELLGRILRALAGLPARGFVTVPDYVDRTGLEPPPGVVVSGYVRHAAVLPHADVLVTHAGLGSVVAALAHGVPMVCLPLGREQPDNARAVERVGAGVALPPDADPGTIHAAVLRQLHRDRTVRFAPDPGRAAALLRAVVGDP